MSRGLTLPGARADASLPGRGGYARRVFTGIVREVGEVVALEGGAEGVRLAIRAPQTASRSAVGDSVAVDGVCLTVVDGDGETLAFEAVPETLARTTLGGLEEGAAVNVEP